MADQLEKKIVDYLKSGQSRPLKPRRLAREMEIPEDDYHSFRSALKQLMDEGRVVSGSRGAIVLPTQQQGRDRIVGAYRQHRRGFGFVVPTDPDSHEDLFIPPGQEGDAISGDIVAAQITSRGQKDGKAMFEGRITEVLQRTHTRFVGTLVKQHGEWRVLPDGNVLIEPILTPDAGGRHIKAGTKVVVELTRFPTDKEGAAGVITEVLGRAGEKDVDLRSVIIQFNLPGEFPDECLEQARQAVADFQKAEFPDRLDLSDEVVCTIDPDDAKDYDDAISLRRLADGRQELGVHIADVSYFITPGSPLDEESSQRGNSCYFPGHVIPMLPEILSNGVCSLQEGEPRLCKSVFITFDEKANPVSARFANGVIRSARRLRYTEAQAIIDGAESIPHPDGAKRISDYPREVVDLLGRMNKLARQIHKRRLAAGQLVLDLPEIELVLNEEGKVVGARPEDTAFTHTLIEMFMVEANEAAARQLDALKVPFLRRTHPDPEPAGSERLRHFVEVAGHKLPKTMDRKAIQQLLASVRDKPESFAINLAVLKSLSRAVYSPEVIGHYALASQHYCHFTSPIRRYADLLVHRLLASYIEQSEKTKRRRVELDDVIPHEKLVEIGRHISFTERRAEDAERELRKVKILELMQQQVGQTYMGVVTGLTNFGLFVQIREYLIDGLIRYPDLLDDWWDVDERSGVVRGQRTGQKIGIGDVVKIVIAGVDMPRRELDLAVLEVIGRAGRREDAAQPDGRQSGKGQKAGKPGDGKGGAGKGGAGKGKGGGPGGKGRQPQGRQPKGRQPQGPPQATGAGGRRSSRGKARGRGRGGR